MLNDLIQNIDKLHTTQMGEERVLRNLKLATDNIVEWCKDAVKNSDTINRHGKNWYVYGGGNVITVNASSFTVITAHKIKTKP